MSHAITAQRIAEDSRDMVLPHEIAEALRTVLAGENLVNHSGTITGERPKVPGGELVDAARRPEPHFVSALEVELDRVARGCGTCLPGYDTPTQTHTQTQTRPEARLPLPSCRVRRRLGMGP